MRMKTREKNEIEQNKERAHKFVAIPDKSNFLDNYSLLEFYGRAFACLQRLSVCYAMQAVLK